MSVPGHRVQAGGRIFPPYRHPEVPRHEAGGSGLLNGPAGAHTVARAECACDGFRRSRPPVLLIPATGPADPGHRRRNEPAAFRVESRSAARCCAACASSPRGSKPFMRVPHAACGRHRQVDGLPRRAYAGSSIQRYAAWTCQKCVPGRYGSGNRSEVRAGLRPRVAVRRSLRVVAQPMSTPSAIVLDSCVGSSRPSGASIRRWQRIGRCNRTVGGAGAVVEPSLLAGGEVIHWWEGRR